jgi:hypothetical protein
MLRPAEAPVGGLMTLRPHERAKLTQDIEVSGGHLL